MPELTLDLSGELLSGCFYSLIPNTIGSWMGLDRDWVKILGDERLRMRAELQDRKTVDEHKCSVSALHVTGYSTSTYVIDYQGGPHTPFLPGDYVVVNEDLAKQLRESGLKGLRLHQARVRIGNKEYEPPVYYALDFKGKNPCRPRRITPPEANRCPFCGYKPLICPECGFEMSGCPACKKPCMVSAADHEGANDPRITVAPTSADDKDIIEPSRWDGSDFCYNQMITRRVLDFLLRVHAFPFYAEPAPVDVSTLDAKARAELKKATGCPDD